MNDGTEGEEATVERGTETRDLAFVFIRAEENYEIKAGTVRSFNEAFRSCKDNYMSRSGYRKSLMTNL
ncbi:uncharacterized protein LOC143907261 isoform X3 [Temnothorax americanus]|uniref:uncharacterized protein LOC143907261 isoform X3 n=1 Tax=Temnothorax americanus TaxID=1964332 RepID=UPI004068043E